MSIIKMNPSLTIFSGCAEQPDAGPKDKSVFKQNRGALLADTRDRNEVYCIGIIDTLTVYDLKKKGESVLKSVLYNKVRPKYLHIW